MEQRRDAGVVVLLIEALGGAERVLEVLEVLEVKMVKSLVFCRRLRRKEALN